MRGYYVYSNSSARLLREFQDEKELSRKIDYMLLLAKDYQYFSLQKSIQFSDSAYLFANKLKNNKQLLMAMHIKAETYINAFQAKKADSLIRKGISIARNCGDIESEAYFNVILAFKYSVNQQPELVWEALNRADALFKIINSKDGQVWVEYQKSEVFWRLGLYEMQIEVLKKCLIDNPTLRDDLKAKIIARKIFAETFLINSFSEKVSVILDRFFTDALLCQVPILKADAYFAFGDYFLRGKNNILALKYYSEAERIYKSLNAFFILGSVYTNMSHAFQELGLKKECIKYCKLALAERELCGQEGLVCSSLTNLGYAYLKDQSLDSAEMLYKRAFQIADQRGIDWMRSIVYNKFYELYKQKKSLGLALFYFEKYKELDEMKLKRFNSSTITSLKLNHDSDIRGQQIQQMNDKGQQSMMLLYFLIALFVVVLLVFFIFRRQYHLILKMRSDRIRERLLRLQMNPHFIFNALIAVQSYIYQRNAKEAVVYLNYFSDLIRRFLASSHSELITLQSELEIIEYYLKIQMTRYENKFNYEVIVDENIDVASVYVPPMLLQPFLENSIEHGFNNLPVMGMLTIKYSFNTKHIQVLVEDNGHGLNLKTDQNGFYKGKKNHLSMALKITSERLAILNKRMNKNSATLEITNIADSDNNRNGVRVVFSLPYKQRKNV